MKVEELRIGNYIDFRVYQGDHFVEKYTNGRITGILKDHVFLNEIRVPIITLVPIPLTEEWLSKLGLVSYGKKRNWYDIENISISALGYVAFLKNGIWINLPVKLEYVHEVQNIVFLLTKNNL